MKHLGPGEKVWACPPTQGGLASWRGWVTLQMHRVGAAGGAGAAEVEVSSEVEGCGGVPTGDLPPSPAPTLGAEEARGVGAPS